MSANDHIIKYLDYFISLPDSPQFAVLINGPWGAGKTWLIRDYLSNQSTIEYLYVSLYGAASTDEISSRMFEARYPLLSSNYAKIAGRVLKGLVRATISVDLDNDKRDDLKISPQIPDFSGLESPTPTHDGKLIILDDVERCFVEPNQLWGYINKLVEHDGAKVVLLCCESRIDNPEEYKDTKEKNVGITLSVRPDFSLAFEKLAGGLDGPASKALLMRKDRVLDIFQSSGYQNLRILRFVIRDFQRIYSHLSKPVRSADGAIETLLDVLVVLALEVYYGALPAGDIGQKSAGVDPLLSSAFQNAESREERPILFADSIKKYSGLVGFILPCPSFDWWRDFFSLGLVDSKSLNQQLENRFITNAKLPIWQQAANVFNASDQEFAELMPRCTDELISGRLRGIGPILHVSGVILWVIENEVMQKGADLDLVRKVTVRAAKHAIERLADDEIYPDPQHSSQLFYSYDSTVYAGHKTSGFSEVVSFAESAYEGAKNRVLVAFASRMLDLLLDHNWEQFARELEENYPPPGLYADTISTNEILSRVDVEKFVEAVCKLPPAGQDKVIRVLHGRGKRQQIENADWIRKVVKRLGELVKERASIQLHMVHMRLARISW